MPASRRDHLVETALRMFCQNGYHATGIDAILAESGVAKMTLYNHFKSKDELILAALQREDEQFRDWFLDRVERRATSPRERLLAVFDVLREWFEEETFRGCSFINAAAEYGELDNPIHAAAAAHKRLMIDYLRKLARDAGARDPKALAASVALLSEGAIVIAHVVGDRNAAENAKRAAKVLLDDAL